MNDTDLVPVKSRTEEELEGLLFSSLPVVLAANFINGTLIAVIFAGTGASLVVAIWWLLLVLLASVRMLAWVCYGNRRVPNRRWTTIAIVSSASSGVIWGAAGFLFFADGNETQRMVLGFVLGGMGAGAMTALTPYLPAFYAYLFPSVLPFCLQLALQGDADHLAMAGASVLYLVALAVLGRRANGWLVDSISRRFENADLVRSLERRVDERTRALHGVNEQLHRDIAERRLAQADVEKYGERQAATADFGRLALSGIDLETLFDRAVALVRDRLEVPRAAVLDGVIETLRAGARGMSGAVTHPVALPTNELTLAGLSDRTMQPMKAGPGERGVDLRAVDAGRLGDPQLSLEAAILPHGRPYGILVAAADTRRAFSKNDITFLQSIANMLAAAIERKRAEESIQELALRDPLTGLPNRGLFCRRLRGEVEKARYGSKLALLLVDLDDFKDVNDTFGHLAGDRLLADVAGRLKACVRKAGFTSRLGGDEFALILSDLRSLDDATSVAQRVIRQLSEPFHLDGSQINLGASVGITVSPAHGIDADGLLRNADLALYRAKTEGGGVHRFYAADMAVHIEARKTMEQDLRRALEHGELFLEYQPFIDLNTRRPVGVEALLRWRHPDRGVLSFDAFGPVAETTGAIVPIGRWALRRIAEHRLEWRNAGLQPLVIAANTSASLCRRGDLAGTIERIAAQTGGDLDWLELEVSEQALMPAANCTAMLENARALGVRIAVDDFGTGYCSVGRLHALPVDKVRIGKGFVSGIGTRREAETAVRAIIGLAKGFGMSVTADGVENEAQVEFLIAEGCDYGQGPVFSAPLSPDAFATMLRQNPLPSRVTRLLDQRRQPRP
ncbi:MAG: EAL domain-containing protein [Rhodospirillales bacterium]|nr:EAL domain-containing protein [Rhodospirillales bacterium]